MITCIVLSAGLSERFGSPKAIADLGGTPVIKRIQENLLQSNCDKIVIVLGANAHEIQPSIFIHSRIHVVYNKSYYFGQTSSVQEGWRQADQSSKGIMFLPVDCPLIKSSSVDYVIEYFNKHEPDILIPSFQNKKGHPPVFHQRLKSKILNLPVDCGINSLFTEHPPQTIDVNDRGIIESFNTPEEFERIKLISKQ